MAAPSVTYTFTNGTTADATQVNTNFTDLISGMSDGTKDFTINQLTVNGAATFNGAMTFGNASGDDLTFTGSVASSIPIKATATYNFGAATLGLLSLYVAGTSSFTTRIMSAATASYTFTLPPTAGTSKYIMETDGAGTMTFVPVRTSSDDLKNLSVSASVGSSALTISVKSADASAFSTTNVGIVPFRNSTAATGTVVERSVTAALTDIVISSGSTMGHVSAVPTYIYVYLVDSGSGLVIGASSKLFDQGSLTTTTALAGSGNDDSGTVLYTTATQTSKPIRLIARLSSTQATAGTWAAVPTEISMGSFWPPRMDDIVTFTPSVDSVGTVTNNFSFYTRRGKFMKAFFDFQTGTSAGTTFAINVPGSLTIDPAMSGNCVVGESINNSIAILALAVLPGTSTTKIYASLKSNSAGSVSQYITSTINGNSYANGTVYSGWFEIPIKEWGAYANP